MNMEKVPGLYFFGVVFILLLSTTGSTLAMASSQNMNSNKNSNNDPTVPQLPESSGDDTVPTLKLGEKMKFDHLGPIIINSDGSTRRIGNWDTLTEKEKEVTWRRISKRNEERRQALLQKELKQKEAIDGEESTNNN